MDPISIPLLVTGTWTVLGPFVQKAGTKLLEKAGEAMPDVIGKVWDAVKQKMESKPETASLLQRIWQRNLMMPWYKVPSNIY